MSAISGSPNISAQSSNSVAAGANPQLNASLDIPDTNDPTSFIEETLKKRCAGPDPSKTVDLTKFKEFKLHGNFEKENNATKLSTFRNGAGPECYCMKRTWTVTGTDEFNRDFELKFTKTIYTSIQVPPTYDGHALAQTQYMAGIAASMYCDVVESMVKSLAGQTDELYAKIKDHMSKIRHDRFVKMVMLEGKKEIDLKDTKKLTKHDHLVTSIRLDIRTGNAKRNETVKENKEYSDSAHPIIALSTKIKKVAQMDTSYQEKLKAKKYQFSPPDTAPHHVKEMARMQSDQTLKDALIDAEKDDVADILEEHKVDKNVLWTQWAGKNREMLKEWNDRTGMLKNRDFFSQFVFRFAARRVFSPKVQADLTPGNNETLFQKLEAAYRNFANYSPIEKQEINFLMDKAMQFYGELEKLKDQMDEHSGFLILLADDKEGKKLQDLQNLRNNEFGNFKAQFNAASTARKGAGPAAQPAPVAQAATGKGKTKYTGPTVESVSSSEEDS